MKSDLKRGGAILLIALFLVYFFIYPIGTNVKKYYHFRKDLVSRCFVQNGTGSTHYTPEKPNSFNQNSAIAVLVDWDDTDDVYNLINKLLPSIDYFGIMHIILFSYANVSETIKQKIVELSNHDIKCIHLDFDLDDPGGIHSRRFKKESFLHSCRFWFRDIWSHPIIQTFEYLIHLETRSCFVGGSHFNLKKNITYMSLSLDYSAMPEIQKVIRDFASQFQITPRNPEYFEKYNYDQIPFWHTHIEIIQIKFMLEPEVKRFVDAMNSSPENYRWGIGPLRFATMALFSEPGSVQSLDFGNCFQHPCRM